MIHTATLLGPIILIFYTKIAILQQTPIFYAKGLSNFVSFGSIAEEKLLFPKATHFSTMW